MKKILLFISLSIFSCGLCREALAVSLTNYPSWDGATHASNWGAAPNTTTFGETFRATVAQSEDGMSAPILESVRFQLQNLTGGHNTITFNAYLYQWNGTSIVGPSLATPWNASIVSGNGYQNVGASFGPVSLTPGLDYIVLFTTIGNEAYNTSNQSANWGGLTTGAIANSGFFYNNGTNFSDLSTPWSTSTSIAELAFSFNFRSTPVPETSSGFVGLPCVLGLLLLLRRFVWKPRLS